MRSEKILLKKMTKEEVKEQLPNWFEGNIYEIGDEVCNPYSGETVLLDAAELSMYDLIKGAEMLMLQGIAMDQCIDIMNQGQDWFLARNPSAYMILLD